MIKNIIFDLGGVIINYKPEQYISTLGFDEKTADEIAKIIVLDKIWAELDIGMHDDFDEAVDELCSRFPHREKELRIFFDHPWWTVYYAMDEGLEFFNKVASMGYNIYFLTNFSKKGINYLMDKYEFFKKGKGIVISSYEGVRKPDPKIYEILLERYSLKPEESIFIDDFKDNINAANEFGIYGILYTDPESAMEELEDALARD